MLPEFDLAGVRRSGRRSDRLDYYHRLERERIHLLLLDDARRGLEDIAAGRTRNADSALAKLQQRRKTGGRSARKRRD